ncbi:MAG: hypothetical protein K5880_22220 [Hydrogenophaga sp.]|uniref:hypothetical protein n=1 Tax=Hydrogenophaga sp. TaxID=1904254 RepID=UPI0026186408|nr:hypothetical protein [Hydrogenophaga sp.]MCV0441320.1 hypothetical protein [Hydrogenophaga sp.]
MKALLAVYAMAKNRTSVQPDTSPVGATGKLAIAAVTKRYQSLYYYDVVFDASALGVGRSSWVWLLLEDLTAEAALVRVHGESLLPMRTVLESLAQDPVAHKILAQTPQQTDAGDIRRLFGRAEELAKAKDTATRGRGRSALRSFIFSRSHTLPFSEEIDPHRVRFKPKIPFPRGTPRALISDLSDISNPDASAPIGALSASSARELVDAVKARTQYDLLRVREACIAEMTTAASLRERAILLRRRPLRSDVKVLMQESILANQKNATYSLKKKDVSTEELLIGVLKVIHEGKVATIGSLCESYSVPFAAALKEHFFRDTSAQFRSRKIFEIEYRACVEELFAAFHLIHTHVGWNWSSIMSLQADQIDLSAPGAVVIQSFKSKTDDDTPAVSIDLAEPGVKMAVDLLLWNRRKLVECGFLDPTSMVLWSTRPSSTAQEPGFFHPTSRLQDFKARHGLPNYSFDQVRTQVLFNISLTKGGIESARLHGGHRHYGTTERYVGNIVQERISSALNLEFSKRLEREICYLFDGGARDSARISLLRPLGDGASCINPSRPPPERANATGGCDAEACHTDGGCPNRRIFIDDARVEEVLRLDIYYRDHWQRLWQDNPERFVKHVLPNLAFNAALLLTLQRGAYGARVRKIKAQMK